MLNDLALITAETKESGGTGQKRPLTITSPMSRIELTQVQRAGHNLRRIGSFVLDTREIVAHAQGPGYAVLYLRAGGKVFVQESLEEIDGMIRLTATERATVKRFKRSLRECKAMGVPVDQAFAALWEEVAAEANLSDSQQGSVYQELVSWTKRWLK